MWTMGAVLGRWSFGDDRIRDRIREGGTMMGELLQIWEEAEMCRFASVIAFGRRGQGLACYICRRCT